MAALNNTAFGQNIWLVLFELYSKCFIVLVIHKDISLVYFRQKILFSLVTKPVSKCIVITSKYITHSHRKKQKTKKETTVEQSNSPFPSLRMIYILEYFGKQ